MDILLINTNRLTNNRQTDNLQKYLKSDIYFFSTKSENCASNNTDAMVAFMLLNKTEKTKHHNYPIYLSRNYVHVLRLVKKLNTILFQIRAYPVIQPNKNPYFILIGIHPLFYFFIVFCETQKFKHNISHQIVKNKSVWTDLRKEMRSVERENAVWNVVSAYLCYYSKVRKLHEPCSAECR